MAFKIAEAFVQVTADGKPAAKQVADDFGGSSQATSAGSGFGSKLIKGIGGAVAIGSIALVAALGAGVGAVITNGVKFDSAMQNYTASFTPLLGGADNAKAKLAELSAFAASTPFTLEGLAGASQTLLSFGETNAQLLPDLKMLGDISQGNEEKMKGLSLVFGQVQSNGKLMGQDLLQMINQGFNPLPIIAAKTGESMSDLRQRMSDGKVSFDEVKDAMVTATSAGGMFYGSMDLGAKTLTGSWSSTTDGMSILSGSMVSKLTPALTGVLSEGLNPLLGGLVALVNGSDGAQAAVDSASAAMLTQVQNLGPAVESIAGSLSTVFTALGPVIGSVIGTLVSSLATLLPSILTLAGSMVSSILEAIMANAPTLLDAAVPLILSFVAGLMAQLPALAQLGINLLVSLLDGITTSLPTLIPAVVSGILLAIGQLFDPGNLTQILQSGLAVITALVTGIIAALPGLIAALPQIILGIITFLINAIPTLIDAGLNLFLALVGALPEIITGLVAAIPKIVTGLVLALMTALPKIISAGIRLFLALIENLPLIISSLAGAIPQIVTGIVRAFTSPAMIGQLGKAGGDLIKGLWAGISDLGGWLWSKVSGFFGGFMDKVKGFFGIHSPSTLFHDEVGAMIGMGLVGGVESTEGDVTKAAAGLRKAAIDGIGPVGSLAVTAGSIFGVDPATGAPMADPSSSSSHTTYQFGDVKIDAASVDEISKVLAVFDKLAQTARAGKGTLRMAN